MTFVSILNTPPMNQLEFKRVKHYKSFKVDPINFELKKTNFYLNIILNELLCPFK